MEQTRSIRNQTETPTITPKPSQITLKPLIDKPRVLSKMVNEIHQSQRSLRKLEANN